MIKRINFRDLAKSPLMSGSILMVGGSLFINMFNYLYHLLMGRILGPVDYGTLASIFSIIYIAAIIPLSSSFAIVKFISSAKDKSERALIYKSIKKLYSNVAVISFLITLVLSPFIANFLHIKDVVSVASVSIIMLFSLLTLVNQATLQGVLKFSGVIIPNLISSLTKLALGIALVLIGLSVRGAMYAVIIGAIFAYLASKHLIKSFPKKTGKEKFNYTIFFKYSVPVLLQALAFTSIFTVDLILVKHFFSPFDAGLYAALSTLGKIIYFAAQPITSVMFPIISSKRSKGESYRKVFYLSAAMTLLMSLGVTAGYMLLPKLAIGLLYGEKFLSIQAELVWMGVFITVYTLAYLLANFLLSINRTKIIIIPLLAALIQIPAIYIWHQSILQVIQVSLGITIVLLMTLVSYMGYNELQRVYVKKQK